MALDRFAASWREQYVSGEVAKENARDNGHCVFCVLGASEVGEETGVIWRDELSFVTLNAFPYGSGHLLVLPLRHVAELTDLSAAEYASFTSAIRLAVDALQTAYRCDGMNVGMNLGQAAGAGIPQHLHAHALPRWAGDTNFMTTIGETRVLPESLTSTWQKVTASWPTT